MSKRYGFNKKPQVIKNSYGIACCRYNTTANRMEILMVKKRYTFYFVEFVRGHYPPTDDTKLVYLFNRISTEEKVEIESMDFDRMWYRIWREVPDTNSQEYTWFSKCKRKFEMNFGSPGDQTRLRYLLSNSTSTDCMWEIPKGRRDPGESELTCALRELTEETGLPSSAVRILPDTMELKISNNKATYINKYFLALELGKTTLDQRYRVRSRSPKLSFANSRQISEIIDVRWMSLVEVRFLDQTNQFTQIINNMFKLLRSRYRVAKLTEAGLL